MKIRWRVIPPAYFIFREAVIEFTLQTLMPPFDCPLGFGMLSGIVNFTSTRGVAIKGLYSPYIITIKQKDALLPHVMDYLPIAGFCMLFSINTILNRYSQ